MELPIKRVVSRSNGKPSQDETVSFLRALPSGLDFWLGCGKFACDDSIVEITSLVRAIAEGLVGRVSAAAQADDGAPGKAKRPALRIDNFELAFHPNGSIIVDGYLGTRHLVLRKEREHVRDSNVLFFRVRRV